MQKLETGVGQGDKGNPDNTTHSASGVKDISTITETYQAFVEIDGIRVYGSQRPKQLEELVATLNKIEVAPESELHLARHFTVLSREYQQSLLGKSFQRTNRATGGTETVTINEEMIEQALATKGSKFYKDVDGVTNPRELIEFVKEQAIKRANDDSLPVFDGGFCEKMLFSIEMNRNVGQDGVVAVDCIDSAVTQLRQQSRGKLGEDDFMVNLADGHQGVPSSKISVVLGVIDGTPHIFTAYPGSLAPDFPRDHQGSDELAYNQHFWETHAFIA